MAELRDANSNPWYVLMTLYGEQEGDWVDRKLAKKNRQAWNAWSCQNLTEDEFQILSEVSDLPLSEFKGWETLRTEILSLYQARINATHPKSGASIDLPTAGAKIDF